MADKATLERVRELVDAARDEHAPRMSRVAAVTELIDALPDLLAATSLHIGEDWQPTAEAINALPMPLRRYIHDLATRCDPSGDVQTIWSQREQIAGLVARVKEMKVALERCALALPVLENMCRTAKLTSGADRAAETLTCVQAALRNGSAS